MAAKIALIDNYDSFTFNFVALLHALGHGQELRVFRNDEAFLSLQKESWDLLIIGPGPGRPTQAGDSLRVLDFFHDKLPILGICLGMQCINEYFGGETIYSPEVLHGKTSLLKNYKKNFMSDLPESFPVARYHSLAISPGPDIEVLAVCDNTPMVVRHRLYKIYGVQFHPESFLGENGLDLIKAIFKDIGIDG